VLALAGLTASSANLIVGTAFAWFAGYEVRSQQQLMHALVDAETKLADQAAAAERQRIARKVHDLVAHTLSVTMLHLTGARLALQDVDVTEATAACCTSVRDRSGPGCVNIWPRPNHSIIIKAPSSLAPSS
jgi:signal transduction histidine kinase